MSMWDERYSDSEYVYGTEPNEFLAAHVERLPRGRILSLAEGEGRNAVWLAQHGYDVTAVDSSAVGLKKVERLAAERGVSLSVEHADLAHYHIEPAQWDGVVSIFCHLPAALRRQVYAAVVAGLKPGGVLLLEAYTPRQLEYGTGGPPTAELMADLATLRQELAGLEFDFAEEQVRFIHEGRFHHGDSAVVQIIASKPGE
jgi:SAM-dependent methyltransferase